MPELNQTGSATLPHDMGGSKHMADTLANLQTKVSDAVLTASAAALTSGRVPYVTAGGLVKDKATFTYNETTERLSAGSLSLTEIAQTGSVDPAMKVTGAAHTALTASTEFKDVHFDLSRTVTFDNGAITTQRGIVIDPPTYAFAGPGTQTITMASTLAVSGPPVAGANGFITNRYAATFAGYVQAKTILYVTDDPANPLSSSYIRLGATTDPTLRIGKPANSSLITIGPDVIAGYHTHTFSGSGSSETIFKFLGAGRSVDIGQSTTSGNHLFIGASGELRITATPGGLGSYEIKIAGSTVTHRNRVNWEDATSFLGTLAHANTGNRTYTFKDADGTVAFVSDITFSGSLAATQVAYGTGADTIGGEAAFTYNATTNRLTSGSLTLTELAQTGSVAAGLLYTGAAHTSLTASTERYAIHLDLSATQTFATGALTSQRAIYIDSPTYAFDGASTITNAATMFINGMPAAGANATLTNKYSLWVENGNIFVNGGSSALVTAQFSSAVAYPGYTLKSINSSAGSSSIGVAGYFEATNTGFGRAGWFVNSYSGGGTVNPVGVYISTTHADSHGLKVYAPRNYFTGLIGIKIDLPDTELDVRGLAQVLETATTGTVRPGLLVTGAAHTALTASTERSSVYFDLSATQTFATGGIATQRAIRISAPTYAFAGASNITDASTVAIGGAPIAGTNATITNSYALRIESGGMRSDAVNNAGYFTGTTTTGYVHTIDATDTSDAGSGVPLHILSRSGAGRGIFIQSTKTGAFSPKSISIDNLADTGYGLYVTANRNYFGGDLGLGTTTPDVKLDVRGSAQVREQVSTGTVDYALEVKRAAHTALTASTEHTDVYFDLSATQTFATGNITTQRAVRISAPTYAFAGASTISRAATLRVENAPQEGANCTISVAYAIDVPTGTSYFSQIVLGNGSAAAPSLAMQVDADAGFYSIGVSTMGFSTGGIELIRYGNTSIVYNEPGNDRDFQWKGNSLSHMMFLEGNNASENIAFLAAALPNWQSMDRGFFIGDVTTAPTGDPTSGGFLYSESGALKWRGSSGTISTMGPADPHCPKCGADFMHEWENQRYGYLAVCMKCMADEIGDRPWIMREKVA